MPTEVLIPAFLLVGIGYSLGKILSLDPGPLVKVAFWCFSPALIFESLRTSPLSWDEIGTVAAFVALHYGAMYLLSLPVGKLLFRQDPNARAVTSLVLVFGNCGNLGIPLLLFAFGERGASIGAVFLAANTVLLSTLGVGIAAGKGKSLSESFVKIFKVPWLYAVAAGFLARELPVFPLWLSRTTSTLRDGAIAVFLLLLGIQLSRVDPRTVFKGALGLALARLSLGTLLSFGISALLGLKGILRGALVIEGSVPSAVNSFILAYQFDRRPDLAAAALFLSTLFSMGTLSLVLLLLS